jgi:hypothetical protein
LVDLRQHPERLGEVAEAVASPALSGLLLALNGPGSTLWTAKCDLWLPEAVDLTIEQLAGLATVGEGDGEQAALACYVDILPRDGMVFPRWEQAEAFSRDWVRRLEAVSLPSVTVDLIVRQAIAGETEGFGVTAYLSAEGETWSQVLEVFASALHAFAEAMPCTLPPAPDDSQLQCKSTGE